MQKTNTALILKLAAVAAAVSMQGLAVAQPAAAPTAAPSTQQASADKSEGERHGHSHKHHKHAHGHHHGQRAAMLVPGYGPLGEKSVEALKLTDAQKKLVEEARSAQKAEREERFTALKQARDERQSALEQGKIDPRAALDQAKQKRQAVAEHHDKIAEKWLAVWDALDDGQKKQVAEQFAEKAKKRAERMKDHAERRAAKPDSGAKPDGAAQATAKP